MTYTYLNNTMKTSFEWDDIQLEEPDVSAVSADEAIAGLQGIIEDLS